VRFGDLAIQQLSANPGYIFAEFSNSQQQEATGSSPKGRMRAALSSEKC
jgi:hypothetical protein